MDLRRRLVAIALEWQAELGVSPQVTSAIGELDAANLVGCPYEDYKSFMAPRTAVSKGYDFEFGKFRYQVKSNRPSGKPGSAVTMTAKVKNYDWDRFIWILYSCDYTMQEAWMWDVGRFKEEFALGERLSPAKMRRGIRLFPYDAARESDFATSLVPVQPLEKAVLIMNEPNPVEILLTEEEGSFLEWLPAPPHGERCSLWNGNDIKGRRSHHGPVPVTKDPFHLELYWERAGRSAVYVGCFRLHQRALLRAGFIREDRQPSHNRIRIAHDGRNVLSIQVSAEKPGLAFARLPD